MHDTHDLQIFRSVSRMDKVATDRESPIGSSQSTTYRYHSRKSGLAGVCSLRLHESLVKGVLVLGSVLGACWNGTNDIKRELVNTAIQILENSSDRLGERVRTQYTVLTNQDSEEVLVNLNKLA
jgi:hypothetical protein